MSSNRSVNLVSKQATYRLGLGLLSYVLNVGRTVANRRLGRTFGRTTGARFLFICLFAIFASATYSAQEVMLKDSFDRNSGGWTVVGDAQGDSVQATYKATGGNPGGYIEARDDATGGVWYWNAPASFCNALQEAWRAGGRRLLILNFDLRQSDTSSPFSTDDVILKGGGYTLAFVGAPAPGISWTSYNVPLTPARWRNQNAKRAATEAEMAAVLGSLTSLGIRGEYRVGGDIGGLDNVGWRWQPNPRAEAQSHLFMNGSFEYGPSPGSFVTLGPGSRVVNGWVATKGTIDYVGNAFTCPCGQRCIDLDGTPGPGAISQTFSTVPGRQYYVSFSLGGNPDCDLGMKTVLVKAAGERASYDFDTSSRAPWVTRTLSFTATSPSTTLEFESLDRAGNCGPAIDNVQVTTEPAPASCAGASTVAKVLFVKQSNARFEPITQLLYDQPFYVEAHFDVPPTENRKEVKLEWAAGQNRSIVVTKTDKDPKVFRSEKITPKRPATIANETSHANTPSPSNNPNRTTLNSLNNSAATPSRSENASTQYRVVGVAADDQLTIRSGPGATNTEVGKIPSGASGVRSLGEERQVGSSTWVKISYRGVEGWVNRSFLARQ